MLSHCLRVFIVMHGPTIAFLTLKVCVCPVYSLLCMVQR